MTDTFRLYAFTRTQMKDQWGIDIEVETMMDTDVVRIIGKRPYNNGYETVDIAVAEGADGRIFYRPIEVDYFGGQVWYQDGDTAHQPWLRASKLSKAGRYVDASGRPVTKEMLIEDFGP